MLIDKQAKETNNETLRKTILNEFEQVDLKKRVSIIIYETYLQELDKTRKEILDSIEVKPTLELKVPETESRSREASVSVVT